MPTTVAAPGHDALVTVDLTTGAVIMVIMMCLQPRASLVVDLVDLVDPVLMPGWRCAATMPDCCGSPFGRASLAVVSDPKSVYVHMTRPARPVFCCVWHCQKSPCPASARLG